MNIQEKLDHIKSLKSLVPSLKLVLGGSLALQLHGAATKSEDIDIILINPSQTDIEELKKVTNLLKGNDSRASSSSVYSYVINGTKVDIFIDTEDKDISYYPTVQGIPLNNIVDILRYKVSYGRIKDIKFLIGFLNKITSESTICSKDDPCTSEVFINNDPSTII